MKAEVRTYNGTPTLYLNDQPVFADVQWVGYLDPNGLEVTQTAIRAFAKSNVHIYTTDALNFEWCGPRPGDPRHYDFSTLGPRLQSAVDADPDALLNLRLSVETKHLLNNWWNKRHPDELEVLSNGETQSASYASLVWQADVKDLLKGLIDYLHSVGLYDRVIGYQICVGTCGEWIKDWSSMSPASGDFSEPMRRQFRAWLRQRYDNDVAALQAAWADPQVTFETAEAPSGDEQDHPTHFLFRDPRRERKTIDFYECHAETCADALLAFCRTVKDATNREKLTGAFYGYIMELAWNNCFFNDGGPGAGLADSEVSTVQRSGHLGLHKVLRSPDLDFLVSPYGYAFRGLGGDCLPMQPTDSVRLHGKLYLLEEDTLMHNNFDADKRMHPISRSIAIYQRNFAQVVTHGIGVTWLESNAFQEDPSIIEEAHCWQKRYQEIGTWALQLDRKPASEVAVFLDDESYLYEGNKNNIDLPLIWHQRVMTLNRFGAPHDVYLLNDLLEGRLPPYKLYIFLNTFHLNQRRRQALRDIVCRNNQTALWFYAAGYINSDAAGPAVSTDHMTDLTGFRFGLGRSYWSAMMHLTDFTHPITRGLPQDLFWGTTRSIAPIFHLEDPQAQVLGEVIYGLGRCKPGLGVKTFHPESPAKAWTSVYSATPTMPAAVLRGIARHAGVHLYSEDGDVIYGTPDLLGVHTVSGGCRNFSLPRQVEVVYDLYNQRLLKRDTNQFEVQLPAASSALYYTGQADRLDSLKLS